MRVQKYLHCLIEPSISGVALTSTTVDHLMGHIRLIATVRLMPGNVGPAKAIRIKRNRQRLIQANQAERRLDQFDIVRILIDHQQLLAIAGPGAAWLGRQNADRCRFHRQARGIAEQEQQLGCDFVFAEASAIVRQHRNAIHLAIG